MASEHDRACWGVLRRTKGDAAFPEVIPLCATRVVVGRRPEHYEAPDTVFRTAPDDDPRRAERDDLGEGGVAFCASQDAPAGAVVLHFASAHFSLWSALAPVLHLRRLRSAESIDTCSSML